MMKYMSVILIVLSLSACASGHYAVKEEYTVDHRSPSIELGKVDVQFDKMMGIGGLRKYEITVNYYPAENVVGLQYRVDLMTYTQYWNRSGREVFISALAKYKEDYSQRKLITRNRRKNKRCYGIIQGFMTWQTASITMRSHGHPDLELGYYFKEKSPFFTINQRSTTSVGVSSSDTRTTHDMLLFFTIAQANELAALFDPLYLQGINNSNVKYLIDTDVEFDDYSDDIIEENIEDTEFDDY